MSLFTPSCTSVFEQTVNRAVIPFLVDLLENRLHLHQYLEEEARRMMWEEHEGNAQKLRTQVQTYKAKLKNVQKMTVEELMTSEEARPFIYEAREGIEKAQRQLAAIEKRIKVTDELMEAVNRVCQDVGEALKGLEPLALQAVVTQVFRHLTIGKSGHGSATKAWIETYEFREELKDLLARSTLSIDTPAVEMV